MKKAGRPTDYNEEVLKKTANYIKNYEDFDDVVPSVAGLADYLGVVKQTLYNWAEKNEEFLDSLGKLKQKQEKVLGNKGLSGEFNSTITKLMLSHNHDYKEKSDVTSDNKPISNDIRNLTNEELERIAKEGEE